MDSPLAAGDVARGVVAADCNSRGRSPRKPTAKFGSQKLLDVYLDNSRLTQRRQNRGFVAIASNPAIRSLRCSMPARPRLGDASPANALSNLPTAAPT